MRSNVALALLLPACIVRGALAQDEFMWLKVPVSGPSSRHLPAAAYDSARDRVVLHSGTAGKITTSVDDTWEFDGSTWINRNVTGPGRQYQHSMAYDAARGVCILAAAVIMDAKCWSWNGESWTRIPQAVQTRWGHRMAFNPADGFVYFHGGYGQLDTGPLSDLHRWDGQSWMRLYEYTMPGRQDHGMAFDALRGVLVIQGGWTGGGGDYLDTWEWNGVEWRKAADNLEPLWYRSGAGMVFHEALGKVVLFGGALDRDGTWTWDGVAWRRLKTIGAEPAARRNHAMVYDSARGRLVLFGGFFGQPTPGVILTSDETWVLVPACRANCVGDATPGGQHKLDIQDFSCFQNAFALGDLTKADLGGPAVCAPDGALSIADFTCFQNAFTLGCP